LLRRFVKGKRGISTVLGTVYFVIIMLLAFNLVLWEIGQMDTYQQSVNERNQIDWERLNEKVEIVFALVSSSNHLNVTVTNVGGLTAHLVDLWVTDRTPSPPVQSLFVLNDYVSPGSTVANIGDDISVDPTHAYKVRIVTERGNTLETTHVYPPGFTPFPPLTFSFGSMKIKYTGKYNSATDSAHPERDSQGWVYPWIIYDILYDASTDKGKKPANTIVQVKVVFMNTFNRPITIVRGNLMFQIASSHDNSKAFFIGGVLDSGAGTYLEEQTATLVFRLTNFNIGDELEGLVMTGIAVVSSDYGGSFFFSGAILLDGLLVVG